MGERVTISQSVGLMMLGVFSFGVLIIVEQMTGSWKATIIIITVTLLATLWVVTGGFLIFGR